MADESLTSLQTRLIKIGARAVRHTRVITFQLAEVAVIGDLFDRKAAIRHSAALYPSLTFMSPVMNSCFANKIS
jgi:hypothetical protein